MTAWLGHGPLGPPGGGYGYGGLVLGPFNVHERTTRATSRAARDCLKDSDILGPEIAIFCWPAGAYLSMGVLPGGVQRGPPNRLPLGICDASIK